MRLVALLLAVAVALPSRAVEREQIATINVAASSVFTYLGCVARAKLQKRALTRAEAARCLGGGAAAGAGFYQAKRLAARGDVTTAWLVANAAGSIAENTIEAQHPLARLGYTFGPFRLRVATPFDRARESYVDLDVSVVETGFLVRTIADADEIEVRDGMIWWETRERRTDGHYVFNGYAWGIYPGVWTRATARTRHHEAVHAVQALQLDSFDPPALTFDRGPRLFRLRHIRLGAANLTDNVFWGQMPYHERWVEIEAYRLVDDRTPPR